MAANFGPPGLILPQTKCIVNIISKEAYFHVSSCLHFVCALTGKISMLAWDAFFYIEMPTHLCLFLDLVFFLAYAVVPLSLQIFIFHLVQTFHLRTAGLHLVTKKNNNFLLYGSYI